MKAVILAGGMGTRISEESSLRPKPMIEIGGKPILWHILKGYAKHGVTDFVICLGYKGYVIKEYFANYCLHLSDVTFDLANNRMEVHQRNAEPWRVTLVDTGEQTMTGGRVRRIAQYVKDDKEFCLTYGDGVGDVDVTAALAFHRAHGRDCTMTVAQPPGRFGAVSLDQEKVMTFQEKPIGDGGWVNAGFFICSPSVINRMVGDSTIWEREPMESLARDGHMRAWYHRGFWQPMDTLRDKQHLESLWASGTAPWRTW
jgi:glucose-1-phosphate cytidylyltransferase